MVQVLWESRAVLCLEKEGYKMKYFVLLLWVCVSASFSHAQTVSHTVQWEAGVNRKVVKEWSYSLHKTSSVSSTTYIRKKVGGKDKLHRVGHRDVIVWVPSTTNLTKDFTLVIWFHGHYGYVPGRTFENRTLKQIVPLTKNRNFVIAIPEMPWSVHTSTPTKRNSLLWTKKGQFLQFVAQVHTILSYHNQGNRMGSIDHRIVGHSAGGSTIKRLGMTGDLCKLKPSMVVWSDSSYGPWLQSAWDGCLKDHRDILVKVFVAKGDSPWRRAVQFMGQFQGPQNNLELHVKKKPRWSHKLIGDNIVKLSDLLGDINEAD